jgi:hypothetical protein
MGEFKLKGSSLEQSRQAGEVDLEVFEAARALLQRDQYLNQDLGQGGDG